MTDQIVVRPVRPDEYVEAGEATARAYREFIPPEGPEWQEYVSRIGDIAARARHTVVLVALVDGTIAGTATVELDRHVEDDWRDGIAPDEAHLRMLGVDPAFRRRGVARALMEAVLALAEERGRARITLETTPQMQAAQHMYESLGFVARDREEQEPWLTLLHYELRLPEH